MKHKILLVSSEFPPGPGGIGHHAYSLVKALSKFPNYDISVLCNADYVNPSAVHLFDQNSKVPIFRFNRAGRLTQILRIIQFLYVYLGKKPDVVIYTGLFSLWLMNFGILNLKIKKIAIIHGHEPIFGNMLTKRLTKYSFKNADVFIPVSRFSMSNLEERYNKKQKQLIKIIPNGIDLEYLRSWSNIAVDANEVVHELIGFPKLLTVGHTSSRKGQHNVITALPYIKEIFPDVMYYIVGRDVNNKGLYQLAVDLGVCSSVQFLPPVTEHKLLKEYYMNSDIFMLLSENQPNGDVEGFGIVALEANFFGLPVIGASGCGVEDAVEDGISGYLVDPKKPSQIVERIKVILEQRDKFGEGAKKFALDFEWDGIVKQYEEILCAE